MSKRAGGAKRTSSDTLASNRRAFHRYHVLEKLECGIELRGTEVKSVKAREFSFSDSYAVIRRNRLTLVGLHITPYRFGNQFNHEPTRDRALLANRDEIKKLAKQVGERGLTLIPLRFYLMRGLVKVELGVCRGKQVADKRQDIRRREEERALDRAVRNVRR